MMAQSTQRPKTNRKCEPSKGSVEKHSRAKNHVSYSDIGDIDIGDIESGDIDILSKSMNNIRDQLC